MSSGSIQRLPAGSGQGCSWGPLPPGPPGQGTWCLLQALFIRQLIRPQESHSRAFSARPLHSTPTTSRGVSSGLAPMGLGTPGDVRTGAPQPRPQASSFGGAAPPPPPRAYVEGPGCPGAPGTWKGQREHSRGSASWAPPPRQAVSQILEALTSTQVGSLAQHRDRGGGWAVQQLRCRGAEPGSRKPPSPEET